MLKRNKTLLANFGYLSALQGFNLVFPLITYPYLIRVLQPETYGAVIFAQGIVAYYAVFINFGFQTWATKEVAQHRDNPESLSSIVSSVLQAKVGLWLSCLIVHLVLVFSVPAFSQDKALYLLAFGGTLTGLFFPQWYFQGIEQMRYITLIWFGIRMITVVGIFTLIHDESDYLMLPLINSIGAAVGCAMAMVTVFRHRVRLSLQRWQRVKAALLESAPLFYSHGFASVTDKGGTLIVGAVLGKTELAYYNLAERVINLAATVCFNIGRTLYPNVANSLDKGFSRRATRLAFAVGLAGTVVIAGSADLVVTLIGGEQMRPAVALLQLLSPYMIFAGLGPVLVNVLMIEGRQRSIFTNTLIAGLCYVATLALLAALGKLSVGTVASTFIISIAVRVGHRFWVIKRAGLTDWLYDSRALNKAGRQPKRAKKNGQSP